VSSAANGHEADLTPIVATGGDAGVPKGRELLRFAEAVTTGSTDVADASLALITAVGRRAFAEAACTVAVFSGLVRVADATGIPLDESLRAMSAEIRTTLGVDSFGEATNTV
jgi:hypothetical protein